jgi:hypothetical protein
MLTGGSKDDIHYMLDDRGSSTILIQQSLTGTNGLPSLQNAASTKRHASTLPCHAQSWRPAGCTSPAVAMVAADDSAEVPREGGAVRGCVGHL